MPITIESIKSAKLKAKETNKPVKLHVGSGVRLFVSKKSAVFQMRYRIKNDDGKRAEKILTLNKLKARNDKSLTAATQEAFDMADDAKQLLEQGLDPSVEKRIVKSSNSKKQTLTVDFYFESWAKKISKAADWSPKYLTNTKSKFKNYISPAIGNLPVERITTDNVINLLEPLIEKPATYKKVRTILNMFFDDAVIDGKSKLNPVPRKLVRAVSKYKAKSLPAVTDIALLQNIFAGIKRVNITPLVRTAALLQAFTVMRSQTVVAAKWSEFDLVNRLWKIPRIKGRMKLSDKEKYGEFFVVPLSKEVIEILADWRSTLIWQDSEFLFPSNSKTGHITIEALTLVYRVRLNIKDHCAHGWRSSFSTLAHDAIADDGRGQFRTDVIERCLDHVVGNEVTQAYNRGELLELRRSLMCWWSTQLVDININLISLRKKI